MAIDNIGFDQWGMKPMIDAAKAAAVSDAIAQTTGYVQTATSTSGIGLAALGAPVAVAFATPMVKQNDGQAATTGELSLSAGGILFPSAAKGRWSPSVTITASAAVQMTVELRLYDENGVEVTENGYPARRVQTLALGQNDFPAFRSVTKPTGRTRVLRLSLSAALAVNVTKVELSINRYA